MLQPNTIKAFQRTFCLSKIAIYYIIMYYYTLYVTLQAEIPFSIYIMKKTTKFCILIILFPFLSIGQKDSTKRKDGLPHKSSGFFLIAYAKLETFPLYKSKGEIKTSFPFQSFDNTTKITTNDTFKISPTNPLSIRPLILSLSVELNKNKNCFGLQLSAPINYFTNGSGSYGSGMSIGYGRIIGLKKINNSKIVIKPFINFSIYTFGIPEGDIDNQNKDISALGSNYNSTFIVTTHYKYSTTSTIHNATKLGVEYNATSLLLSPQIVIANNRMQRIYWSLNLGWAFNLYNSGGVHLTQYGGGKGNLISFNNNDINVSENDKRIYKFPYKISGISIGFSIGAYLNK